MKVPEGTRRKTGSVSRVPRVGTEVTFKHKEARNERAIWTKSIPSSQNSKCKGPDRKSVV